VKLAALHRRSFVKLALGAPALHLRAQEKADALVIGAGIAGLAAAQNLQASGLRPVVLEARNRIGGRVYTDHSMKDAPLDLGCLWIHGTNGNPLQALAEEAGLAPVRTDYDAASLFDAPRGWLDDRQIAEMDERFGDLLEAVGDVRDNREEGGEPDISLRQAIDPLLLREKLKPAQLREVNYSLASEIEHEYAAGAEELSLSYWDQDELFDGGDTWFAEGFSRIPYLLARNLDVRLSTVVESIHWGGDGVRVQTNRGEWRAPMALLTLPLGVLRRGAVRFDPPLPEAKRSAIAKLNTGALEKVLLRFNRPFWTPGNEHIFGLLSDQPGAWNECFNLMVGLEQPVLCWLNAGSTARRLAAAPERDVVQAALQSLRAMFGAKVPAPVAAKVTHWATDPYTLGGFTSLAPGAEPDHVLALAQPLSGKLFFAGEATSLEHLGSAHGALLSGRRAAGEMTVL
jgi:monoamine oxidase